VHRDIKPDNVFIVQINGRELPKLLDFGVAKARKKQFDVGVSHDTAEGEWVGTPHYMSPEQARGASDVDHRSDVWALGVVAFECLLGYPPFVASGLGNVLLKICTQPLPVPSAFGVVPAGFDAWFARACARAPQARFPSILEAASELREICLHGRLEGPRPPARSSSWRALWRWFMRHARVIARAKEARGRWRWFAAAATAAWACGPWLRADAADARGCPAGCARAALSLAPARANFLIEPEAVSPFGNVREILRRNGRAPSKK
jgi:serine/threonine protein kinase